MELTYNIVSHFLVTRVYHHALDLPQPDKCYPAGEIHFQVIHLVELCCLQLLPESRMSLRHFVFNPSPPKSTYRIPCHSLCCTNVLNYKRSCDAIYHKNLNGKPHQHHRWRYSYLFYLLFFFKRKEKKKKLGIRKDYVTFCALKL